MAETQDVWHSTPAGTLQIKRTLTICTPNPGQLEYVPGSQRYLLAWSLVSLMVFILLDPPNIYNLVHKEKKVLNNPKENNISI